MSVYSFLESKFRTTADYKRLVNLDLMFCRVLKTPPSLLSSLSVLWLIWSGCVTELISEWSTTRLFRLNNFCCKALRAGTQLAKMRPEVRPTRCYDFWFCRLRCIGKQTSCERWTVILTLYSFTVLHCLALIFDEVKAYKQLSLFGATPAVCRFMELVRKIWLHKMQNAF